MDAHWAIGYWTAFRLWDNGRRKRLQDIGRKAGDQRGKSFADFRLERVFRNKKVSFIMKTTVEIVYLLKISYLCSKFCFALVRSYYYANHTR